MKIPKDRISEETERLSERPRINEAIIVEGRDDAEVVARAVDALCITTHGFGISHSTWELIDKAYREKGIIILTDPDHAGEEIRKKLTEKFPDARHAYLARSKATRDGDIGIENAEPELVAEAILKARAVNKSEGADEAASEQRNGAGDRECELVDMNLLRALGFVGEPGSSDLRKDVSERLGIGYGNNKAFLRMLNGFGISKKELEDAVAAVNDTD